MTFRLNIAIVTMVAAFAMLVCVAFPRASQALQGVGLFPVTNGGINTYVPTGGLTSGAVTAIKTSSGSLYCADLYNPNAATVVYVNFYNSATITYGTTVPTYSFAIQGSSPFKLGPHTIPVAFSTVIYYTVSTSLSSLTSPSSAVTGTVGYY